MAPYVFRSSNTFSASSSPPPYSDYCNALDVAFSLIRPAFDANRAAFFFLFGFSGTGKSSIEEPLWWRLNSAGMPFSTLTIRSESIAGRSLVSARNELEYIEDQYITREELYPLLIILDEAEALAPDRKKHPSEKPVCWWTVSLLKSLRPMHRPSAVCACTNYPDDCDATIKSEIGPSIYVPEAPLATLQELCAGLKVSDPVEVAKEYWAICSKHQRVPLPRPLVDSVENVKDRWTAATGVRERAQSLFDYNTPPLRADFGLYEKDLSARRDQARRLKEFLIGPGQD